MTEITVNNQDCPLVLAKVMLKNTASITVGAFYRQPSHTTTEIDALSETLLAISRGNQSTEFVIGGDFNLPGINWGESVTIKEAPNYGQQINERFIELCDTVGLTQVVEKPTRANNILDLFLITSPDRCADTEILPGISDHCAVYLTYDRQANRNKKKPRMVYLFKRADMGSLKEDITQYYNSNFNQHLAAEDINETWEMFKDTLHTLIRKHIPQRTIKNNHRLPWINEGIRRLMRRRKRARAKAKTTMKEADWDRYKKLDKVLKKELRTAHVEYLSSMFSEEDRLCKMVWAYIKSRRKENVGIPPLADKKGKLCEDARGKAEILCNQYTSVFTKDDPRIPVPDVPFNLLQMPVFTISDNGIKKLLEEIKVHKANGPDLLPNRVLRECSEELAPFLGDIFRRSLREGRLPNDWLTANVVGIYKKGSKQEASNYRPVSLTSVTCKILEHIIFSQIMKHYTRHNFISNSQHGFQKGLSCETQLAATIEELQRGLDQKTQYDILILDFQKAFDKVPHRHLLKKLEASGIRGCLHEWLKTYLTCRTQRVVVDGSASQEVPVLSGVPQGTVLGPLMFLTYINDINHHISGTVKLFADDALVFHPVQSDSDCELLQKDLDVLYKWSKKWRMAFNASKCHVIQATRKRTTISHNYFLGREKLSVLQSHPYLGVEIDNTLSWNQQIENTKNKGTRTLNMVRRNFTKGTSTQIRNQIYTGLVRPTLEYGCVVWDPHQASRIQKLESVQSKGARYALQDWDRHSSVSRMKSSLGWRTLQERRLVNRLTFFHKSVNHYHKHRLPSYVVKPNRTSKSHHSYNFQHVRARTDQYMYSFLPRTIKAWNMLPQNVVDASTPDSFRSRLIKGIKDGTIVVSSKGTGPRPGLPIHVF